MLTLPDFKEKQILFIFGKKDLENRLQFRNDNILFLKDGQIINQLSCYRVLAIFVVGEFSLTTVLIKNCRKYGISIFLLKNNLENYAHFLSAAEGNYLLRQKQYAFNGELFLAKNIVKNKIYNQINLLSQNKKITKPKIRYKEMATKVDVCKNNKELLGIEGSFTKKYFSEYFKEVNWYKRLPRAKVDVNNLLLDIGYTMLFNFTSALLSLYGFDLYKGFYHQLFFQRKSLSCDLMEPLRCLIEKQILKSYNLKQIDAKDFKKRRNEIILSYDKQQKYVRIFSDCLMNRKEEIFNYLRDYYYFILNSKNNKSVKKFPIFKI